MRLAADLHIHTSLSPCAEPEMTPRAIVRRALSQGLAMIAVCDHNTAGNAAAVQAASGSRLSALAGIEITTSEEAHVIGLFPRAAAAVAVGRKVEAAMQRLCPGSRPAGSQANASALPLAAAVELIHQHRGLAIAAHVDRPSFSVLSQLGLWPDDAAFDAVELSPVFAGTSSEWSRRCAGLPVICSSDSHFLSTIGLSFTILELTDATFSSLSAALSSGAVAALHHA